MTQNSLNSSYQKLNIGVLGVQGAVSEHIEAVNNCGARAFPIRNAGLIPELDGLIIPGGESTTIGRLSRKYSYCEEIHALAAAGKPVFGTCAGLILLAKEVEGQEPILPLMSIKTRRNAFGRQRESFETDLLVPVLGEELFCGVFIRAPQIISVGEGVEVLSVFGDIVVAAREKNLLVTAFHPELTDDTRLHRYFLDMVLEHLGEKVFSGVIKNR